MIRTEKSLIQSEGEHYIWMVRKFNSEYMWVWIINLLVYIGVIIAYFLVDGHESIYKMYIPLDILLNVSKALYYFMTYWMNKREEQKEAELRKLILEQTSKKFEQALTSVMSFQGLPSLGGASLDPTASAGPSPLLGVPSAPSLGVGAGAGAAQPELSEKEVQLKLRYEENLRKQLKRQRLLEEVKENDQELDLDQDTYTMAFKALHFDSMNQMELNADDVHGAFTSALTVFMIQSLLIFILAMIIFGSGGSFEILLPPNISVLGARFVCSILMHLQVEGDMRQGLVMMKYVTNHAKDFSNPIYAFLVALMQTLGGIGSEFFCILFLCSLTDPILILIRFIAFASIGKIDNFYASALPGEHKLQRDSDPLKINTRRADMKEKEGGRQCSGAIARFIYKTVRIGYASFFFYFLPYLALFLPQMLTSTEAQ